MPGISFRSVRLLTSVALVCMLPPAADARRAPMPPMDPRSYISPSGEYTLNVNPSHSDGRDSATYHLTHNGKEVWSGEKPFTFHNAGVTDDGTVAGYAYSYGIEGVSPKGYYVEKDYGDFIIAILSPAGEVRTEKHIKRGYGKYVFEDQFPQPEAAGLLVDRDNNRCIIRIEDPDINRRHETWIVFHLSTGKAVDELEMSVPGEFGRSGGSLISACLLRGTPLILLYWRTFEDGAGVHGGRFDLVDPRGKTVWTMSLPNDYEVPGDEKARSALIDRMNEKGAILDATRPREFDVFFAAANQRVTFAVTTSDKGGWQVREIGRKPYVEAPSSAPAPAAQPNFPALPFKQLPSIALQRRVPATLAAVRGVGEYDFDDRGRIAFLRCTRDLPYALVLIDQAGKVLQEISLEGLKAPAYSTDRLTWTGDDTFVLTLSGSDIESKALAWHVDVAKKTVTPIEGFDCPPVEALAGYNDGGFIALTRSRYQYTSTDGLQCFDAAGKTLWRVESHGYADETWRWSTPTDLAITPQGQVAVLDDLGAAIHVFRRTGEYARRIPLQEESANSHSYCTNIACDRKGNFFVYDFSGSPHIVQANIDGRVERRFDPTYADGRQVNMRDGIDTAPDGRLWTCDGYTLLRLSPAGSVDLILGRRLDDDQLSEIDDAAADSLGRIYVLERRTRVVHVFGPDGTALHQCKPELGDLKTLGGLSRLAPADSGDVYVGAEGLGGGRGGTYLHFSPEGKRLGAETLGIDSICEEWQFRPGGKARLVVGYQKAYLVDGQGQLVRSITRKPDGNWLNRVGRSAVAPDGGFALTDEAGASYFGGTPTVNVYTAAGEPVRTIRLQEEFGSLLRLAYNGRHLFITNNTQVLVMDAAGRPIGQFRIAPDRSGDLLYGPFLAAEGSQLWFVSCERLEVDRYAIPSSLRSLKGAPADNASQPATQTTASQAAANP